MLIITERKCEYLGRRCITSSYTFINFIEKDDSHLYEAALTDDSNEVATTIAGYIAKKIIKRSSCIICKSCLVSEKGIHFENKYFDLSRGGLTIPSSSLAEFESNEFAILDSAGSTDSVSTRIAAEYVLMKYSEAVRFTCEAHVEWGMKFSSRIITNIFYNNKQQIATDTVRMDVVPGFKSRQRFKCFIVESRSNYSGDPVNLLPDNQGSYLVRPAARVV